MITRITLVEARAALREATRASLVGAGFEVEEYETGEAALEGMRARPSEALVTDCTLDGIGGAELAARARTGNHGSALFVVAMAERGDAAPPAAFDEVLAKPVDMDALIALLRR